MVHATLTGAPTGATPPLEILTSLVAALERSGVRCVLGGSGLLAALGLADAVADWDLTTDAALDQVLDATRDLPRELMGPNGIHADQKVRLEAGRVELIVRFAIVSDGGTVRLPSLVHGAWRGVPVGSPEVWAAAYRLMGRPAKWKLLRDWLREHGADRGIVARLIEEPLPADLRI
jgi:hypothetical protein